MAKVRLNPVIQGLHGQIDGLIFRSSGNGETVVYKAPERAKRKAKTEPGSQPHPFADAHAYAREAMADPEMAAYYEQEAIRLGRNSPYHVAFSRYLQIHKRTDP
jgi:hypothetical protein